MKKDRTYGRFYRLFNLLPKHDEETKCSLVLQFTDGRTEHLGETSLNEYNKLCRTLEDMTGERERLRKKRSQVLRQMQLMGVDTTNWRRVDLLCKHPKIMGKPFKWCTVADFDAMFRKLKAIERKQGGFKVVQLPEKKESTYIIINKKSPAN